MSAPLLELDAVSKKFRRPMSLGDRIAAKLGGTVVPHEVRAVDGVSLSVSHSETVGLVGESGCGKSTLGRIAAGILPPTSGVARLDGKPVMSEGRHPHKLTTRVQTVFQDPFASLNPRRRIGDAIAEGPVAHGLVDRAGSRAYVADQLSRVGLDPSYASRFPHQFSGGQRQRIAIARALAMQPDLLICDEPVASLDVSIQAQVLNLFLELRQSLNLTAIFISHDLGVVRHVSDRVAIMYLGRIVEIGPTADIYAAPKHPYTQALLSSVPRLNRRHEGRRAFKPIAGELPSPTSPPTGCHFHPRCPLAEAQCRSVAPELRPMGLTHWAACHLAVKT
ncbi:MAG: ATP-binding cassette domain-containing protein [Alphaproteobacteria bacterium]|nr:ATP-binding cassette domain-containing protein [Alphaproteobacteria bacterium]